MKRFSGGKNKKFAKYVSDAIDSLPERILNRLSNVAIVIEDEPTRLQRKKLDIRKNEVLFGLYEGIPQTERGSTYQGLPDKITIFKKAIESHAEDEEEIKHLVRTTVWHEVAHHFGMEEEEIRERERLAGH